MWVYLLRFYGTCLCCVELLFTVCLFFMLDQIEVTMEDKVTGHEVPLDIILRRPVHFDFEIEFVDKNGVSLGTRNGEKGVVVFSRTITVNNDAELRARFKIGDKVGPYSEPVAIDVETPGMLISQMYNQVPKLITIFSYRRW